MERDASLRCVHTRAQDKYHWLWERNFADSLVAADIPRLGKQVVVLDPQGTQVPAPLHAYAHTACALSRAARGQVYKFRESLPMWRNCIAFVRYVPARAHACAGPSALHHSAVVLLLEESATAERLNSLARDLITSNDDTAAQVRHSRSVVARCT